MIPSRIFPKINIPPCPSETEFHESSSLLFQTAILSGRVRQHPRHMMLWGIFLHFPENRIARNAPYTPCRCKSVRAVSAASPTTRCCGAYSSVPPKTELQGMPRIRPAGANLSGLFRRHPRHTMLWGIFLHSPENRIARNAPHTPCRCKSVSGGPIGTRARGR